METGDTSSKRPPTLIAISLLHAVLAVLYSGAGLLVFFVGALGGTKATMRFGMLVAGGLFTAAILGTVALVALWRRSRRAWTGLVALYALITAATAAEAATETYRMQTMLIFASIIPVSVLLLLLIPGTRRWTVSQPAGPHIATREP